LVDFDLPGDSFLFQRAHKWHDSGNTLPNKNQFSVNLANVSLLKNQRSCEKIFPLKELCHLLPNFCPKNKKKRLMQSRKILAVLLSWNDNNNRKGRFQLLVQKPSNPNFIITKTK